MYRLSILPIQALAALTMALAPVLFPAPAGADVILNVSLDVTGLRNHTYGGGGPYSVDFLMTGGQGNNDSVVISNFAITAAALGNSSAPTGDVSGGLTSTLTVGDASLLNDYNQVISPNVTTNQVLISFQLDVTTHFASGGTPDNFSFSILDQSGAPIPTTDAFGSLFNFDLTPGLTASRVSVFETTSTPTIGPPVITSPAAVPEPSSALLVVLGLATMSVARMARVRIGSR